MLLGVPHLWFHLQKLVVILVVLILNGVSYRFCGNAHNLATGVKMSGLRHNHFHLSASSMTLDACPSRSDALASSELVCTVTRKTDMGKSDIEIL